MKIVYLVNVDWFFASHFLHLAQRARLAGWDVAIATNITTERERFIDEGLRVLELPARRGGVIPRGLWGSVGIVAEELKRNPDAIVHGFGLFGIVVGSLAALNVRAKRRVFTITGRGYSAVSTALNARIVRVLARFFCRRIADRHATRWIAENSSDLASCGLEDARDAGRTTIVGGAGVDVARFTSGAQPLRPPLKCALVARMIWSKGVDLAVDAVRCARDRGVDIELTLAGALDADNPRGLTIEQMRQFSSQPGVQWLGHVSDINAFWATQHVAILPTRGGEGVPKALIEAAACGRPVLTTDVPGCREFAIVTQGWIVPPDDPEALAEALLEIAGLQDLQHRGVAARKAVSEHYTEDKLWETVSSLYHELISEARLVTISR